MKRMSVLLLAAVLAPLSALAADYPIKDKPITIVVPFAAGGPTDRVARDLAESMRKPLGAMSVVIDNAATPKMLSTLSAVFVILVSII